MDSNLGKKIFTKSDNFVESEVDGEAVLMDIDTGRFYSLAETGKHVWALLDGNHSVEDIVAKLSREYDVSAEDCAEQVGAMLVDLQERNLISKSKQL